MASSKGEGCLDIALNIASDTQRLWVEIEKEKQAAQQKETRKGLGEKGRKKDRENG